MKVKIVYNKKPDFAPKYVNGAVGGYGPQGEIFINFFCEKMAISEENFEVIDKMRVNIQKEDLNDTKIIVRDIETGVIMNRDRAMELYNWLGKHLNQQTPPINIGN
jgi:hypothetical protein